jgi:hypothetical protein
VGMVYAFATNRWGVRTDSAILVQLVIVTAAIALATLYVWRRAVGDLILGTARFSGILALGTAVATGALATTIVFFPEGWGGPAREVTAASIATVALITLLPLLATALAPWSFSRLRHR